jgi:hypothetical protein
MVAQGADAVAQGEMWWLSSSLQNNVKKIIGKRVKTMPGANIFLMQRTCK